MKKSFVLHKDSLFILDELSDAQAGQLFKAIKAYQLGEKYELDFALNLAFVSFKNQFERDALKYESICQRNQNNGSKGGRPKKPTETEKTQSDILEPKKPDSDSDSDSDKKRTTKVVHEFLTWFNLMVERTQFRKGRFHSLTKTDENNLNKLRKNYPDYKDFETAFLRMSESQWVKETNNLTPAHFLRNDNFSRYLNMPKSKQSFNPYG